MHWIRWWGVAAFGVIVGGVVAVWLLFADTFVRWGVEAAGTRLVGAQVDVAAADVGFSPARIELRGIAVTNPNAPMRNALELERLAFDIDWIGLLIDRIHIDEIALEGLRLGTERARSGAIGGTQETVGAGALFEKARQRAEIPPLEVPSVGEVLEREALRSPEVIAEAKSEIERRRSRLAERIDQLPGEQDLERYRAEVERAKAASGTAARLKALKDVRDVGEAVRDDLKRLRQARDEVKEAVAATQRLAKEARQAPQADIERLYRKYTDPGAVAGELAHYLLGPKVEGWINQGWYWYARLSPYLGRGDGADAEEPQAAPAPRRPGRNVVYPEAATQPRVLVRRVSLGGAAAAGGELNGRITDIAIPAARWSEPLRMNLDGRGLGGMERLRMAASVDRRRAEQALTQVDLEGSGADLSGVALGPKGLLHAQQGRADFQVEGSLRGSQLDLGLQSTLQGAAFSAREGAKPILREVGAALDGAGRIEIGARIGGTMQAPTMELTSSLDELLKPLLRNRLQGAAGGFRKALAERVTERTGGSLSELETAGADLQALQDRLKERLEAFEQLRARVRKTLD